MRCSSADLNKLTSANHCFALVCTREIVSTCKQFSSELSLELSSSSWNCCTFFDEQHTDVKWPFFDICCTFAGTRDTLFFLQDVVYDHNTCMSVRKNFRNFSSRFSSLISRILIHLSSFDDCCLEFSCHGIS